MIRPEETDDGSSNQEEVDAKATEDAEAEATEIVNKGPQQPFDDSYKKGGQPPYAYYSKTKDEVQLMGWTYGLTSI